MRIKSVSNNIKVLRLQNDSMSQQELADKVGCTRQTIISIEKNKYSPSHVLVCKIAEVLHADVNEIILIEFE